MKTKDASEKSLKTVFIHRRSGNYECDNVVKPGMDPKSEINLIGVAPSDNEHTKPIKNGKSASTGGTSDHFHHEPHIFDDDALLRVSREEPVEKVKNNPITSSYY